MMTSLKKYLKRILIPDLKFKLYSYPGKLEKLGSAHYGGWTVPTDKLNSDSVCYLAGAGEDISFDLVLAGRFSCKVFILDPTPRAKKHFDETIQSAITGNKMRGTTGEYYDLDVNSIGKIKFETIGLWKQTETLRFYAPKDQSHVSHSISNLQHTDEYFLGPVNRLSELMKKNEHWQLDVLKLDIEGAEFEVIDSILEDEVRVRILCIEFHKTDGQTHRIQEYLDKLEENDYKVVAREELDFTFISKKYY
jgi:FkbM family methyltransferase